MPEAPQQPASGLSDRDKMMQRAWNVRQRDLHMLAAAEAEKDALFWTVMKISAESIKQTTDITNFILGFFVPAGQTARLGYKALEKAGSGLKGIEAFNKAKAENATTNQAIASGLTAVTVDLGLSMVSAAQIQKVANKQVALGLINRSAQAQKAVQVTVRGFFQGATKATTGLIGDEANSTANNVFGGNPTK